MDTCAALDEEVRLAEHDADWISVAADERIRLERLLHEVVEAVEHVGSTSVPGLAAKPLLDLVVGVSSGADLDDTEALLIDAGYRRPGHGLQGGLYGVAERDGICVSVYVTYHEGSDWRELLATRNYLRTHPHEADNYAAEKRRVLEVPGNEHPGRYSGGKSCYLRALTDRAMVWAAARHR